MLQNSVGFDKIKLNPTIQVIIEHKQKKSGFDPFTGALLFFLAADWSVECPVALPHTH